MKELYGTESPGFRCAAYAAHSSLKRIAKSEAIGVEKAKSFYNTLRSVVHFFQYSVRGKEALDQAIEIVEMRKGVHLISWCATRMTHLLPACEKANDLLVPLYNTIDSCNIKQEERDRFFHLENIYILKLMIDIHEEFYIKYLRPVDKEDLLANMVYYLAQSSSQSIGNIEAPQADAVAGTIELD